MSRQFNLAQLSDTHVRTDDGGASVAQIRRALNQARAYRVDAIVMTGDLANAERADEYEVLAEAITGPPAPLFLLPGNHDDRARLRARFFDHAYLPRSGRLCYVIDEFPVRLVALDQVVPGATHGDFPPELGVWLDETLAQAPDKPTLIALHHPPFQTHDLLFDRIGLHRADALGDVIAKHRQVGRIICGHHHRAIFGQLAHAPVVVSPSTSWVYGLALHGDQPIAPITAEQPGWMLHVWSESGGFASHVMGL